ncbi:MAG: caspase family protein, partial [Marinirhabdus sp.]|nr:caspase family protein [Marinirhabdus sp.]
GIPAQKQLFILDACQSAGALNTVALRGAAEEKAIAQLARSTGTHWLTASGSEQFATEFDELGHGVFTYALLEALSGKADSGDNRITVNEIKAYIESRVPEISQQYKGSPQYPSSFGFGQDFPVSIKK